jgi:hypothetical protein
MVLKAGSASDFELNAHLYRLPKSRSSPSDPQIIERISSGSKAGFPSPNGISVPLSTIVAVYLKDYLSKRFPVWRRKDGICNAETKLKHQEECIIYGKVRILACGPPYLSSTRCSDAFPFSSPPPSGLYDSLSVTVFSIKCIAEKMNRCENAAIEIYHSSCGCGPAT